MRTGSIPAALALALVLATPVIAEPPPPPLGTTPSQGALDPLLLIEQSLNAKDYATATRKLDEIFAAPTFNELPIQSRYVACVFATLAALGRGDLITAHEYSVAATSFPQAAGDDWAMRAALAMDVQNWSDAGPALATVAQHWPANLATFDGRSVYSLTTSMGHDPTLEQSRIDLIAALFDARYTMEYGFEPAYIWRDLVESLVEKRKSELATRVLGRIDDPGILARMRVDRRFDELVKANPKSFDIAAVARARCEQLANVMRKHPRDLQPVIEYMYAQFAVGAFKENIRFADRLLKSVEQAPKDKPLFDDLEDKLNWIYDIKASSLHALGRWDEAMEVQRQANALRDISADKVSQAINLGSLFNEHGQPGEALKALEGLDWGRDLSGYGRMQLEHVRLRAYLKLGKHDEAETVLAYMRQNQKDAPDTWQIALLDFGDVDGAAALFIQRLRDPKRRTEALWSAQSFLPTPSLPADEETGERWLAMLNRPDVTAAIEEVGRREKIPLYDRE
jgi:tetratricopeptide (TPR) repeat protein